MLSHPASSSSTAILTGLIVKPSIAFRMTKAPAFEVTLFFSLQKELCTPVENEIYFADPSRSILTIAAAYHISTSATFNLAVCAPEKAIDYGMVSDAFKCERLLPTIVKGFRSGAASVSGNVAKHKPTIPSDKKEPTLTSLRTVLAASAESLPSSRPLSPLLYIQSVCRGSMRSN